MESHNFQFVTHTQIWGPDDNFTEEADHECAGMRRSNPLLKLNVCSCERDGAEEQSQPAVGRSHNVTWVIRHSAVNRAASANARGGGLQVQMFAFFSLQGQGRRVCAAQFHCEATWIASHKRKEGIETLYKKGPISPYQGFPVEQCPTLNFRGKKGKKYRKQHI